MNTFSSQWQEPTDHKCALVALDSHYQWMLPACALMLRSNVNCPIQAWTWGANEFDGVVVDWCKRLDVDIRRLPDTGQYCEGWEARHHALCVTNYRHVFMLDVDTYVVGRIPWLFRPMTAAMRLRAGELWENYRDPRFLSYFGLPEIEGGYTNYSVWFGEYDRAHPRCRDVLCRTSDLLGQGAGVYRDAGVVGDQDIRNGILHALGCPVDHTNVVVNAWESLDTQIRRGFPIVHETEKALSKDACESLIGRLRARCGA